MRTSRHDGLSLIGLLVVILIIGILAAIAIPSFLAQKDQAGDASAKAYAPHPADREESHYADDGAYTADLVKLRAIEPALRDRPDGATDPTVTVTGSPADAYAVAVEASSGVTYTIARASDGAVTCTCDSAGVGGCGAAATW